MELALTIAGGLALFLYGMKVMSEALQNAADDKLEKILWRFTNNRIKGVFTGIAITTMIQSSSATSVMTVSFVTAGLITLTQSIGVIMGANIGTTVTGWIVAVIGFRVNIAAVSLPIIAIGFFVRFLNKQKIRQWGDVLLGFGILFLGFSIMGDAVSGLRDSPQVMDMMSQFRADGIISTLAVIAVGSLVTIMVQSSSATIAMTMALAFSGVIDFNTACALVLGENIGTTITANIASIGASIDAKRAARVHLLFNTLGVFWVLLVLHSFFLPLVDALVPGNPYSTDSAVRAAAIPDHLAAFHTIFNITNALIFLPLVNFLAFIATKFVPDKGDPEESTFHLKYISTSLLSTPSMNINQAKLETKRMLNLAEEMYNMVLEVHKNPSAKLGSTVDKIFTLEHHIDLLEKEISIFLVRISQENTSQEQSREVSILLQRVNEIEKIGDQCENLLKILRRKYDNKIEFSDLATKQIDEISGIVKDFLDLISNNITEYNKNIIDDADKIETQINELRKELRKNHVQRLNQGTCDVNSGLLYIDMLTAFEKIGDHSFNIAEGISGLRIF